MLAHTQKIIESRLLKFIESGEAELLSAQEI